MKQYEVTFYLINGEIGELIEESSLKKVRKD